MKITVTVEGECAEGKTTVSLLIERALREAGLTVGNWDYDVQNMSYHPQLQTQRVRALAARENLIIDIETVQVPRKKGQN